MVCMVVLLCGLHGGTAVWSAWWYCCVVCMVVLLCGLHGGTAVWHNEVLFCIYSQSTSKYSPGE